MKDAARIEELVARAKTIAVVGAKDKPGHPVDSVGRYLIKAGFTVIPVHPKRQSVWGLTAYPSLTALPGPVDIVDLFRASAYCPEHAREVLQLRAWPLLFWMQEGIANAEVRTILADTPVIIVEDQCLLKFHKQIAGGGHG